jgi:hypothetical protein
VPGLCTAGQFRAELAVDGAVFGFGIRLQGGKDQTAELDGFPFSLREPRGAVKGCFAIRRAAPMSSRCGWQGIGRLPGRDVPSHRDEPAARQGRQERGFQDTGNQHGHSSG